jgi:hypothetical protein
VSDATAPVSASAVIPDPKRWGALVVIAIAQLMVVLDASIVNIALPSMQVDLGISDADRQWVITAYTLAFGGLLLLGGRIADYAGRKKMFIIGLIGFAFASFLGGLAQTSGTLFAARALQGVFAAVLAPAALSLISVTFTDSKERAKAFNADPEVQAALKASRVNEIHKSTLNPGETYGDLLSDRSSYEDFDANSYFNGKGFNFVRLNQLALEHLMGAR